MNIFDFVLVKKNQETGYIVLSDYDVIRGQFNVQICFDVKVFNIEDLEPDLHMQALQKDPLYDLRK